MLNFKKVLNLNFILLVFVILSLFDSVLYACPFSKNTLRVKSSFNNSEYRDRMPAALRMAEEGNAVLASNEDVVFYQTASSFSRRNFLATGLTATITAPLSVFGTSFFQQENQIDMKSVSDEGLAYRLIGLLEGSKSRLEKGLVVPVYRLADQDYWQQACPDLSKQDAKKVSEMYKYYLDIVKRNRKIKDSSEIILLGQLIDTIRNQYQEFVDARSKGSYVALGAKLSITAQEKSRDLSVDVLAAEPAVALTGCLFNAVSLGAYQNKIIFVTTNTNLFIDEVIVPLINNRKVTRWVIRGLITADSRVQSIFANIIRRDIGDRTRQDCFNILKGSVLRHELRHQRYLDFDRSRFQMEIEKVFKSEPSRDSDIPFLYKDRIMRIATEMDAYLDELESDFSDISFIKMLEIVEREMASVNFLDFPTYAALSVIFGELCGISQEQFLDPTNAANNKVIVGKIKDFITSNLESENGEKYNYALQAQGIRKKYGLPALLARSQKPDFSSRLRQRNQL
ncbi:MAG: hypothetical protein Q8O30_13400 [Candidatus Omnitrophota bacterium]|nr:hypothetical protein [Candidatus Omnitrophota bacterium]